MEKKNVLILVDSVQYGGVEQMVYNYVSNMDLAKYKIEMISTGKIYPKAEEKFEKLGIKIYHLPTKKENFLKYISMLNRIIKYGNFNVVHSNLNYWSFISLFLAKKHKVNLRICHVHGIMKNNFKVRLFSKLSMKFSNKNLACSYEAGKSVYGNEKFEVVNNGINVDDFMFNSFKRKELRKKYNILDDEFVVGNIGRFYPVKNHKFLIDIFNNLYQKEKKIKLVLIGDGDLLNECKEKVKQLNIEKNVVFIPTQNNICDYYNIFDIFTLPSLSEGLGMVVVEAQCNGLECIVSTGVPADVNLTGKVNFISTDCESEWVLKIKKIKREKNVRNNDISKVIKEFNAKDISKKMDKIYNETI